MKLRRPSQAFEPPVVSMDVSVVLVPVSNPLISEESPSLIKVNEAISIAKVGKSAGI